MFSTGEVSRRNSGKQIRNDRDKATLGVSMSDLATRFVASVTKLDTETARTAAPSPNAAHVNWKIRNLTVHGFERFVAGLGIRQLSTTGSVPAPNSLIDWRAVIQNIATRSPPITSV